MRAFLVLTSVVLGGGVASAWATEVPSQPDAVDTFSRQRIVEVKLVESGADRAESSTIVIPPAATAGDQLAATSHPLSDRINAFLSNQQAAKEAFRPTGLTRKDYLGVIDGQVRAMRRYQDEDGRIIDPVEKIEKYYATPCYAHGVAVLAASSHNADAQLLESGIRAMDVSVADMAGAKAAGGHGDFYTWPVMLAYELFAKVAPPERVAGWKRRLATIRPEKLYRAGPTSANWNVVNLSGEYLRARQDLTDTDYVETCLAAQREHFTPLGMYTEHGNPMPYDHFPRHYLAGVLHTGYRGRSYRTYSDLLWKGAWTSLLIQSPFGELPTGYRSSHHIWNEAQQAVTFEIYASHYARAGRPAEAGAFKRAARLSLECTKRWIRPDGSGYIVKNRYPIEARHGYEGYSAHTCYNLLACSMLAQAWQFADDAIEELPAPADVGGLVVPILRPFHKIFANAGGTYVEYDTSGDHVYNPTGLIRVHLRGGHPQLGPSDGCAPKYSGRGVNLAIGPEWLDDSGWHRLAAISPPEPAVEILEQSPRRVRFRVVYQWDPQDDARLAEVQLTQTLTLAGNGVTVEDQFDGAAVRSMRVTYPMLVFDGQKETKIDVHGNGVSLELDGRGVRFSVLEPNAVVLRRSGTTLGHRNGLVESAVAEIVGRRAVYRIAAE